MIFLVASLVVVFGMLAATVLAGNTPVLGLDLRGGVSVVLVAGRELQARRGRRRGRRHPQPGRQPRRRRAGDLPPGQRHRRRPAGRERPLQGREPRRPDRRAALPTGADRGHPAREDADHDHHHRRARRLDHHARPHHHDARPPPRCHRPPRRPRPGRPRRWPASAPRAPPGTTPTTSTDEAATAAVASCDPNAVAALPKIPTTSREEDKRKACVVLPDKPGGPTLPRYYLGPAGLTGIGGQLGRRRVRLRARAGR